MKRLLILGFIVFLISCQDKGNVSVGLLKKKANSDYFIYLKGKKGRLDSKEFKDILGYDCQTVSGNQTCIGKIMAMKLFLNERDTITIEKWSWNIDVKITNIDQLYGFIMSYDPAINIISNEDFK